MATRRPSFRFFSVSNSEYIEIGDDIFQILGRWSNWVILLYNNKAKPRWSESKFSPDQITDCGEGYFFIEFKAPKQVFLGNTTKASFFKFYTWLFGEVKLETSIKLLAEICKEEEQNLVKGKRTNTLPLLSEVCKTSWNLLTGNDPNLVASYYPGRAFYNLHTPNGELGKTNAKQHLMLEIVTDTLPPTCILEPKLNAWKEQFLN